MNPGPGPPIQPYRLRVHDRQPPAHQPNGRHRTDPRHSLTMAHPPVAPTSSVSSASQALRAVGTGENCCHFEFYFIRTPTRARSHCPCLFVTSALRTYARRHQAGKATSTTFFTFPTAPRSPPRHPHAAATDSQSRKTAAALTVTGAHLGRTGVQNTAIAHCPSPPRPPKTPVLH
jgi:hypothetical protein